MIVKSVESFPELNEISTELTNLLSTETSVLPSICVFAVLSEIKKIAFLIPTDFFTVKPFDHSLAVNVSVTGLPSDPVYLI